jgi:hypothetical protein
VRTGRRQSIPSSSIDNCAALNATAPQVACGHTNRPRSRRLAKRHSPSPSHQRTPHAREKCADSGGPYRLSTVQRATGYAWLYGDARRVLLGRVLMPLCSFGYPTRDTRGRSARPAGRRPRGGKFLLWGGKNSLKFDRRRPRIPIAIDRPTNMKLLQKSLHGGRLLAVE